MKKYKKIICIIAFTSLLWGCNDDFMQQDPKDKPADVSTLVTTSELELYLNKLYNLYLEGHQYGWAYSDEWSPLGLGGGHLLLDDIRSDNSTQPGNVDNRMNGTHKSPTSAEKKNGWEWDRLKQVNYFLRKYKAAEPDALKPSDLDKYAAEANFFKAYDYFHKLKYFGEVPWLVRDLDIESKELYDARMPREELSDSILSCINYAVENAIVEVNPMGRINHDMAYFLKARFCLFEGTFRKYHTELGLESTSKSLLQETVKACRAIMATGNYSLYNDASDQAYWKLFTFKQNPKADNNLEAILAVVYDGDKHGHAAQMYYEYNDHRNCRQGATRGLVDEYLCEDGKPIYIGGSEGAYQENDLFEGYDGMWTELNNRDPRLRQTIAKPGEYVTIYNRATGDFGIDKVGIYYPGVSYVNMTSPVGEYQTTVTGYRYIKHWMGDITQANVITKGSQTAIEFRYAEVLLMLAEAEAELNTISNATLDETINKLRERAGFDFVKYPGAKLSMANIPVDPRLDAIYSKNLDYSVTPILREIRRERRVELAQEGTRYGDLMRWKAGKLFTVPMRGMKFTEEKQKLYDGSRIKGVVNPQTGIKEYADRVEIGKTIELDNDGFIICYPKSPNVVQGQLPWSDYRYYYPLPKEELIMNENLVQNPGWDVPEVYNF